MPFVLPLRTSRPSSRLYLIRYGPSTAPRPPHSAASSPIAKPSLGQVDCPVGGLLRFLPDGDQRKQDPVTSTFGRKQHSIVIACAFRPDLVNLGTKVPRCDQPVPLYVLHCGKNLFSVGIVELRDEFLDGTASGCGSIVAPSSLTQCSGPQALPRCRNANPAGSLSFSRSELRSIGMPRRAVKARLGRQRQRLRPARVSKETRRTGAAPKS